MNQLVFCLFILSFGLSVLNCQNNDVYVKISKNSVSYANEESYEIWNGDVKLVSSPTFPNNFLHVGEYCLPPSTNNQYSFVLKDSGGDSWSAGSYVSVQGLYGNIVFKNFMASSSSETFPLSLYYSFMRNAEWKVTSGSASGSWTELIYDDSQWHTEFLGFVVSSVTGTQYFRKSFNNVGSMAAYELSLNYKHGVIVYLDGNEIFRDNMPDGPVTSETHATGNYPRLGSHAFIRPGNELASTANILAVEVHFVNNQLYVDFDAYMALYSPTIMDSTCYIYGYSIDITDSLESTTSASVFDFKKNSAFILSNPPGYITYSIPTTKPQVFINGMGIWPNSSPSTAPRNFILNGANSVSASEWDEIISVAAGSYENQVFSVFHGFFTTKIYSAYRLNLVSSLSTYINVFEAFPLVCNTVLPTSIEFSKSSYTYYITYEPIEIKPILSEFANCQITPALLPGLSFDPVSCVLSGVGTQVNAGTTYTMTTTLGEEQFSGTFTIILQECTGTFTQILRTYQTETGNEGFNIIDRTNDQTVLSVALNTGADVNQNWYSYLCLTHPRYEIETLVGDKKWASQSYLYVRAMFNTQDYETVLRVRRDNGVAMAADYFFNIQYVVPAHSTWNYKMGEVPNNWYNNEMTGFTPKPSSGYPDSTNQIQLYKKQFTVSSLNNVAGIVISLKYQYGVLIYLNGHEVFRKGITGTLSTESYATTSLSDVKYRQISLPLGGNYLGSTFTNFVTSGSNTIAIALVSGSASMKSSTFDCAIRLMGDSTVIRNFDYTVSSYYKLLHKPNNIFDLSSEYDTYYNRCTDEIYIDITFKEDRHEWISSVSIQGQNAQGNNFVKSFDLMGKNAEDTEWTLIKSYSDLSWSQAGQRNRYWTLSTQAFNKYRFTNFTGTEAEYPCIWQLGSIQLLRDATTGDIPELSYETTTIFKNIEMAELYPTSEYYTDFSINPALPEGLSLDFNTGMISGTAFATQDPQTYTISAKRFSGETTSCQLTLDIVVCYGGKSLVTLMAHTDTYPREMGFKLYEGKGTSGTLVKHVEKMKDLNTNTYFDYCLPHGIYTYEMLDLYNDGWTAPAGYYLSVDVGAMKFAVGLVHANNVSPIHPTVSFSSYLPFQVTYDDWKVNTSGTVATNWNEIDYDDSTWSVMKAADIGASEATTVYIRREFTLDDATQYNLLNVRVKYIGGVVAYFNGHKVARFNIEDDFDEETESITIHDISSSSKFHVILATNGVVTGKNVIAFEIHRPHGQSSSEPVVFDATGVLDVNDCSFALDSIASIAGTKPLDESSQSVIFDYSPHTSATLPNDVGTYSEWTIENLEGTEFNVFGIDSFTSGFNWAFSIYARSLPEEEYYNILTQSSINIYSRKLSTFEVPVAIGNFRQFKLEFDYAASSPLQFSEFITFYCKVSGTGVCPGIDGYPAVADGQISPGDCEEGYRGYSYRECHNNVLGEVKTEHCVLKAPSKLAYAEERYNFVMGTQVTIPAPSYKNIITKFSLAPGVELPAGLTLDEKTGAITGIPTEVVTFVMYVVYGENEQGSTETEFALTIRKGACKAEGKFPRTDAGETAFYECSVQGSYIGTQKRTCKLGATDGEWEKVQGACVPIWLIVVGIILAVIVIIVIIFFIIRATRKTHSVGGVKGKKKTLAKQKENKVTKEVKV